MTSTQPILQVIDLYKHFGGLVAVDNVSLDIYPGEVVGLVGDKVPENLRSSK
jgi:ABC-type branched-subunit amino acid transport system ATPase component